MASGPIRITFLGALSYEQTPTILIDRHKPIRKDLEHMLHQASSGSYCLCNLNGVCLHLPQRTLLTMTHCMHRSADGSLLLLVEDTHLNWLISKLCEGDVFVDVGPATGAMSLPISRQFEGRVRVIAFEPAPTTNRILRETLRVNQIENVEVQDYAVSDRIGSAEFWEYGLDETGKTPFLPETSALSSKMIDRSRAQAHQVSVTTLDQFFATREGVEPVRAMKIDVEGFEVSVLDGGINFIRTHQPFIAIDIHRHPFTDGTTEQPVRERLGVLGYEFEKMGHVLTCTPQSV